MSIFSSNLKIIGLGVEDDEPGPGTSTVLPDGIHLRWLFKRERGFPWYGYHLLRRPTASEWRSGFYIKSTAFQDLLDSFRHENKNTAYIPLRDAKNIVAFVGNENVPAKKFFTQVGIAEYQNENEPPSINSAINATTVDIFPLQTPIVSGEQGLYGLSLNETVRLSIKAPPPRRYRSIRLRIGFLQKDTVNIFAKQEEITVQQVSVTGQAGEIKTIVIRNDNEPFSKISINRGGAAILNFEIKFALENKIWSLADSLRIPQPIRLPITLPDYPAGQYPEDPESARQTADIRTFVLGQTFPRRASSRDLPVQGTVEVINGSPFVRGLGTNWDDTYEGLVLETDLHNVPHVIMRVINSDRLVLARKYAGPSQSQASYSLNPDPFGQLYDALALLVEGGPSATSMADRFLRPNYHPGGTALVMNGQTRVNGQGTNWSFALEGMGIHFLRDQGTLRFTPGTNVVEGINTNWTNNHFFPLLGVYFSGLPGSILEIEGHSRSYIIQDVVGDERLRIYPRIPEEAENPKGSFQITNFRILERRPYRIERVDTTARLHLDRTYKGHTRSVNYVIRIPKKNDDELEVNVPDQRLLDIITLGSLSPMIAQTLGLHVIDRPPKADDNGKLLAYDYLLLADHEGFFQNQDIASWVNSSSGWSWLLGEDPDSPDLDAAITYDHKIEPPPPITKPKTPKVYHLKDASRLIPRSQQPHKKPIKALSGLTWDGPSKAPLDEYPALYHIWRQFLGDGDMPSLTQPENAANYLKLTQMHPSLGQPGPVIVAQSPSAYGLPTRPADWPSDVRYFDMVSRYGWYSYRISSIDLFGRYSPLSEPAPWWRKGSFTHGPPPVELNSFAVHIADVAAPSQPTGVEAHVLDPADPYIQHNEAMIDWRETLPDNQRNTLIGLRVRWRWTQGHMQQASDTSHFQICYHPHRFNVLSGEITQIDFDGPEHVLVTTDLSISESPRYLDGAHLRVGQRAYSIEWTSQSRRDPLRVRVKTLGPDGLSPAVDESFVLAIPRDAGDLYTDYTNPDAWDNPDLHRVQVEAYIDEELEPRLDNSGQPLTGNGASIHGVFLNLPTGVNLETVRAGLDHVHLPEDSGAQYYRIAQIRPPQQPGQGPQLWLADSPQVPGTSLRWTIGIYERRYEVLLPEPDGAGTFNLHLVPSATEPVAYGHAGVTAHDVRGNSSPVSAPAKVYRVHRTAPDAPPSLGDVTDTDKVYATPADYHGQSYHTVEWTAKNGHGVHVFRALDDAVFERDRAIRSTRSYLDPAGTVKHHSYFPDSMNESRRNIIAGRLNAIANQSDYSTLDLEELNVLKRLPGNETIVIPNDAALQARRGELIAHDWKLRKTHGNLVPDNDVIPQAWSTADRQDVADTLNSLESPNKDAYEGLSNRAMRVLASLPGHAAAFTQIATQPVMAPLNFYRDMLEGRSSNRYFYRVAYVDAGQNRSPLSPSGPPIYSPDIIAPRPPNITSIISDQKKIIIRWLHNQEVDLAEYHIYRTSVYDNTRDIRLMRKVAIIIPDVMNLDNPPEEQKWIDEELIGMKTFYYRVTAINKIGNISKASPVFASAAYDVNPPTKPNWERAEWIRLGTLGSELPIEASGIPAVSLSFSCKEKHVTGIILRKDAEGWQAITNWLTEPTQLQDNLFEYHTFDTTAKMTENQNYRIKLVNSAGIYFLDDTIKTVEKV